MKKIILENLMAALAFIDKHGGAKEKINPYSIVCPDFFPSSGAYADAGEFVQLADGAVFGVEAYTNGPISEVTPDEDFGVVLLGFEP